MQIGAQKRKKASYRMSENECGHCYTSIHNDYYERVLYLRVLLRDLLQKPVRTAAGHLFVFSPVMCCSLMQRFCTIGGLVLEQI